MTTLFGSFSKIVIVDGSYGQAGEVIRVKLARSDIFEPKELLIVNVLLSEGIERYTVPVGQISGGGDTSNSGVFVIAISWACIGEEKNANKRKREKERVKRRSAVLPSQHLKMGGAKIVP